MPTLKVTFDLTTGNMTIVDIADYTGLSPEYGIIRIVDPFGVEHYKNAGWDTSDFTSEDIDYTAGQPYQVVKTIPTSGSEYIQGTYEISIKLRNVGDPDVDFTATDFEFPFTFEDICPEVSVTVDCITGTIVATDATEYGATLDSITTRTITLYHPPSTGEASEATSLASQSSLTVSPIWTTTNSIKLVTKPLWLIDEDTNTYVTKQYTLVDDVNVVCDDGLCSAYQCYKTLNNTYKSLLQTDPTKASLYETKLVRATELVQLIQVAVNCGKGEDVEGYLVDLRDITGCENCDPCSQTGVPTQITPPGGGGGGGGTTTVVAAGTGIGVASATVGSTTTYTVSLSGSIPADKTVAMSTNTSRELTVTTVTGTPNYAFRIDAVTPEAWASATIGADGHNPVAAYGSGELIKYRKERKWNDGSNKSRLVLSGLIGAVFTTKNTEKLVATLPSGFWPTLNKEFTVNLQGVGTAAAKLLINTSGEVRVRNHETFPPAHFLYGHVISVDGISFEIPT